MPQTRVGEQFKPMSFFKKLLTCTFIVLFFLFLLIWIASGSAIRWIANEQLKSYQLALNEQSSISFNPFISRLVFEQVSFINRHHIKSMDESQVYSVERKLSIDYFVADLNVLALLNQTIHFDELVLTGLKTNFIRLPNDFIIAGISVNELSNKRRSSESSQEIDNTENDPFLQGWSLDLSNMKVSDIDVQFDDFSISSDTDLGVRQQLQLSEMEISQLLASLEQQTVSMDILGDVNSAPFNVSVKGDFEDGMGHADAQITVEDFEYQQLSAYLPKNIQAFSSKTDVSINLVARLKSDKTHIDLKSLTFRNKALNFQNDNAHVSLENINIQADNMSIELNNDKIKGTEPYTSENQTRRASQVDKSEGKVSVDGHFAIELEKLNVKSPQDNAHITSLAQLAIPDMNAQFKNNELSVNTPLLSLIDLVLFDPSDDSNKESISKKAFTSIGEINAKDIEYKDSTIKVEDISLGQIVAHVILNEQRQLANLPIAFNTSAESSTINSKENDIEQRGNEQSQSVDNIESNESLPLFSLANVNLTEPTHIYFQDNSFKTPFERQIEITQLTLENISTLDKNSETTFNFASNIDQHANLTLNGKVKPWSKQQNIALNLHLNEFSLPNISSYLGQAAGFEFESGQLDSDINISIVNNELSGQSNLLLRGVDISNDSDEQESVNSVDVIPLGTAFNMLKDDNNNVELDIPLSGNVADPQFGWNSFIDIVTKKAVMAATESYLMQTFVPYANIISIAKFAGQELLKVKVENLHYMPGQIAISSEQGAFVDELAKLLVDQQDLQVKLCPIARTTEPLTHGVSNVKQLAERRGESLKEYLVNTKSIKSKRILLCTPKVDEQSNAIPRVEFTL